MKRVAFYIDGFNLYHGLIDKGWRRYLWLDLRRLGENLLRENQTLVAVRYFTSRVNPEPDDPAKLVRQNTYLEALETLPDLHIHLGYFAPRTRLCRACGGERETYEEKMTDVNISVKLLGDAQDDVFDTAVIVSGDGDMEGLVQAVRERYEQKRVVVAFPPGRPSEALRSVATAWFSIGRSNIANSQLADQITTPAGFVLTRPPTWS